MTTLETFGQDNFGNTFSCHKFQFFFKTCLSPNLKRCWNLKRLSREARRRSSLKSESNQELRLFQLANWWKEDMSAFLKPSALQGPAIMSSSSSFCPSSQTITYFMNAFPLKVIPRSTGLVYHLGTFLMNMGSWIFSCIVRAKCSILISEYKKPIGQVTIILFLIGNILIFSHSLLKTK